MSIRRSITVTIMSNTSLNFNVSMTIDVFSYSDH